MDEKIYLPLRSRGGGGQDLIVSITKKTLCVCVPSLIGEH